MHAVAKKSRTPSPPRPVQAPKRRTEPRDPRRTRLWLAVGAAAILLAAGGAGLAFALRGGDEAASGPCQIRTYPSQGSNHVAKLPEGFEYNSYPPTSGPHNQQTLVFGEYQEPVPLLNVVHNLEHGGVAVLYGSDVPEDTVRRLTAWYRTDPRGLILAPLADDERAANLRDKITLSAWVAELEDEDNPASRVTTQEGTQAVCSTFDEDAFNEFLDDYRAKGPERATLDQLQPGQP